MDARSAEADRDRYLDATLRTFLRHGVTRSRMADIADEAGVSRTTAYRQLGTVDRAAVDLLRRELEVFLTNVTAGLREASSSTEVLRVCALAMAEIETHPLFRKVRDDEPLIIGAAIVRQTGLVVHAVTAALAPAFADLARRGVLLVDDPTRLVEALVRLGITCTIHPPPDGFEAVLGLLLRPGPRQAVQSPRRSDL